MGDEVGAGPRAATGMEENGARPRQGRVWLCISSGLSGMPFFGECPMGTGGGAGMKNRTLKDWQVECWKADKGKFYPHPDSGGVEVNRRHQQAGSRWQERAQGSCSLPCGLAQMAPGAVL